MQSKHLNTLEYPKILERLAKHAAFSASKTLALSLEPTPYLKEAQTRQQETTEADHLLSVKSDVSVGGARDVRPLSAKSTRGVILDPTELLRIRQTLIAARTLQRTLLKLEEPYPRLADMALRIAESPGVVNEIGQAIDENNGNVKDSASPDLARIRREINTAHGRLMERLQRFIGSTQNQTYLQDAIITQREGRYVVPLKAQYKSKVRGVVHDQSSSGATVFMEPLAVVELNNRWRELQLEEENEIRRILAALSEMVGQHDEAIQHTVEALADIDLAFAKAKYAHALDAVEPELFSLAESDSHALTLLAARHPLLDPKTVVPIDIMLPEGARMLVITGPNTGGKTVSLKTMGLLAAMAQAGLRIPAAEGSALPIFREIFADIGDEQSIEQSLSTFSSHMTNIVKILAQCDDSSLVIFDELGAGTDPLEGSALAHAILKTLLERRVMTFVATHYSELKAFAHTTEGVANASMEFDVESLAPTFRLRIGLAGASNAFAIARRLGLSEEIVGRAQGLMSEDAKQVEAMLAEIEAEVEAAKAERNKVAQARRDLEAEKEKVEDRLANIETEKQDILRSVREDARREIKAAREEIRAMREQAEVTLKQAAEETAQVASVDDQLNKLDSEIETRQQKAKKPKPPPKPTPPKRQPRPGDEVFIAQYNTMGEIVAIDGKEAEVQLGHFRTTVPLTDLEVKKKAKEKEPVRPNRKVSTPTVESPGMELDLRGQMSEEAIIQLEQYLDQAFLAQLPWVRIIHGKGSGALRKVVREELRHHPMISSYRAGKQGEGGEGVTVAKLALS